MKTFNRAVKITGIVLITLFAAYVGLAFHLINKTDPAFRSPTVASAAGDATMAEMFKQVYKSQPARFMARDRIGRLSTHLQLQIGHFSELSKHNLDLLGNAVFNSFGVRFGVRRMV